MKTSSILLSAAKNQFIVLFSCKSTGQEALYYIHFVTDIPIHLLSNFHGKPASYCCFMQVILPVVQSDR